MTEPVTKEYPSCKNANALVWFWVRVVLKEGLQCVHFCTSSTSTLAFWRCTLVCVWSCAPFPRHPSSPPFLPPHTPSHTPSPTPFRRLIRYFQRYTLLWNTILKLSELRQRNEAGEEHFWLVLASLWDRVLKIKLKKLTRLLVNCCASDTCLWWNTMHWCGF